MNLIIVSDTHLFSPPSNLPFDFLCYKIKEPVRLSVFNTHIHSVGCAKKNQTFGPNS